MTKKSKFLISAIIIVVLLTAIVVIAATFLSTVPSQPPDEANEVAHIVDDVEELINDVKTSNRFEIFDTKAGTQIIDSLAGYEFTLPSEYGSIDQKSSEENQAILIADLPSEVGGTRSQILANAYNIDDELPGRGAFWGDTAAYLNGDLITNFCERTKDVKFVQGGFDSCSVSTNSYNVTYARLDYSAYDDWGRIEPATFIYIFNPATRNGVVISNTRLGLDQKSDLSVMQSLVDSFSFVE